MPASDRAAADRRAGLAPARARRQARGRPRPRRRRAGPPARRSRGAARRRGGAAAPPATRTRVCTATGRRYGFRPFVDGAWYRCCDGHVRKLVDCCTTGSRRINGDRALTGYCYTPPQGVLRHVLRHAGEVLTSLLICAAAVAGFAGAWSPCGFSAVETLGRLARWASRRCCATFAPGLRRRRHVRRARPARRRGGRRRARRRGGAALAAAIGDRAAADRAAGAPPGARIVAAKAPDPARGAPLRGAARPRLHDVRAVLRGVGARPGVRRARRAGAGVAVGVAFALGRAVPVVALTPLQGTERGIDLAAAMAERPGTLRAIRGAGALAMSVAAVALALGGAPAAAATEQLLTADGTDPSAAGGSVAWQAPGDGQSFIKRGAAGEQPVPGSDPALGPDKSSGETGRRSSSPTRARCASACASTRREPRNRRCPRAGSSGARATAVPTWGDRPAGARLAAGPPAPRAGPRPHRPSVARG